MVLKAFSVHDAKAKAYNLPWYKHQIDEAMRDFKMKVNDTSPGNYLNTCSEDYTLFLIGEYNDENGQFVPLTTPQPIVKAIELKAQ